MFFYRVRTHNLIFHVFIKVRLMKYKTLISLIILAFSLGANSSEWVGKSQIKEVRFVKDGEICGPNDGSCLVLYFDKGYSKCGSLSISMEDDRFEYVKSIALISLAHDKKFKAYTNSSKCNDKAYGFNEVAIY